MVHTTNLLLRGLKRNTAKVLAQCQLARNIVIEIVEFARSHHEREKKFGTFLNGWGGHCGAVRGL